MRELTFDTQVLAAALPAMKAAADARAAHYRSGGEQARTAGLPIGACPHSPGSWVGVRWLEGWSGTIAPERKWIEGGFDMTPAEEVFLFADWVLGLGLHSEIAQAYIDGRRRSYTPEAVGGNA